MNINGNNANNGVFIGACAAITGAALGVLGMQYQTDETVKQAHNDFLREKRISVYTSWLDNVSELAVKEDTAWNALDEFLEDRNSKDAKASAKALLDVRDHLSSMESLEVQFSILASDESSSAAEALMSSHREVLRTMQSLRARPERAACVRSLTEEEALQNFDEFRRAIEGIKGSASASANDSPPPCGGGGGRVGPPGIEDALRQGGVEAAILRDAIGNSGESLARLYASAPRGLAEAQYAEFITAARADLQVDKLRP